MSITVCQGNPETDGDAVVRILSRYLNPAYDRRRFEWLYLHNPAGRGRLWLAADPATGEIVGTASAFPRRMSVGGDDVLAWILGDFCVAVEHRTLGPAVALQRACLDSVTKDTDSFCYDFPSIAMRPVYQRLKLAPAGQMRRLVKILRVGRKLADLGAPAFVARGLGRTVDLLLSRPARRSNAAGLTFALHEGACGEEFTHLAREAGPAYGVCVSRSAAYLNWRYQSNPLECCEILTARRAKRLVAYAVFTHQASGAMLVDLFGQPDSAIVTALARATVDMLRQRGCPRVSIALLDSHPWIPLFRGLGFAQREAVPLMVCGSGGSGQNGAVPSMPAFFLMHGDRDS